MNVKLRELKQACKAAKLIELKQACKLAGVRGYTKLNKENLIDWILNHEQKSEICSHLFAQDVIASPPTKEEIPTGDRGSGRHQGASFVAPAKPQRPHPQPTDQPHQNPSQPDREFVVPSVKPVAPRTRAISIQQPWAWAIFSLDKNIENRKWPTTYRGELYIHAAQKYDRAGATWIEEKFDIIPPGPDELPKGAIIGRVNLTGCSQNSQSPWAMSEQFHFELENAVRLEKPIPTKGQLGFFSVDISHLLKKSGQPAPNKIAPFDRPAANSYMGEFEDGPWMKDGQIRPDFVDWIALDWRQSFPNRQHQSDWQIRLDVFSHLAKPGKLLSAWVAFSGDCRQREKNNQELAKNGISGKKLHPLSGYEIVGEISCENEYGRIVVSPVIQCTSEERQKMENFERLRREETQKSIANKFGFILNPKSDVEVQENLKKLRQFLRGAYRLPAAGDKEQYQKAAALGIQAAYQRRRGVYLVDEEGEF